MTLSEAAADYRVKAEALKHANMFLQEARNKVSRLEAEARKAQFAFVAAKSVLEEAAVLDKEEQA